MTTPDSDSGLWFIWGDGMEPLAEDLSYMEMKRRVDRFIIDGREEVYGENNEDGGTYPSD
jgi:hypothetical protein